jgi:hypothetical protein
MNWDAAGALGEMVGAFAVLATLFYLALQVQHARKEAQGTRKESALIGYAQMMGETFMSGSEAGEIFRRGLVNFQELEPREKFLFHVIFLNQFMHVQNIVAQADSGLLSDEDRCAWLDFMAQLVKSPGCAAYWSEVSPIFTPSMVMEIERHVINLDKPSYVDQYPFFEDLRATGDSEP